jgi:hypothetical protein
MGNEEEREERGKGVQWRRGREIGCGYKPIFWW